MYKLEETNLTMKNQMKLVLEALNELQGIYKDTLTKKSRLEPLAVDRKILLKFAPLTNCDIERSFSLYRHILSDKQHNLKPKNLAKLNFVKFNSQKLK